jgi:hypothetical protein
MFGKKRSKSDKREISKIYRHHNVGGNGAGILKKMWAGTLPPPDNSTKIPEHMKHHFRPQVIASIQSPKFASLKSGATHSAW